MRSDPPPPGGRRPRRIGLRVRVAGFLVVATLPLLALVLGGAWAAAGADTAEVERERVSLARSAAFATESLVEGNFSTVRTLALNRITLDSAPRAAPLFARFLDENPDWNAVVLFGPDGRNLVSAGRGVAAAPGAVDRSADQDFLDVVQTGRPRVTSGALGPVSGAPGVALLAPIDFADGGRGVFSVPISLDRLRRTLMASRTDATVDVLVIDALGRALVDTSPTPVAPLTPVGDRPEVRAALAGQTGSWRQRPADGEEQLVAYAPVGGLGWAVVVRQPAAAAFASSRRQTAQVVWLAVLALASAGGLAWLLGGRVARVQAREEIARRAAEAAAADMRALSDAREAERRFLEELISSAPVAIGVLEGPQHRHVTVNGRYRAIKPHVDPFGLTVAEAFPEWVPQRIVAMLDRVYTTGQQFTAVDCALRVEDAAGFPVEHTFTLVFARYDGEAGRPRGVLVVALDTTEALLARRRIERDKDEFLSMAAHELKTPLTSLNLSVQLIGRMVARGGIDLPRLARSVAVIETQMARATRLIDDLLDVSFMEVGQLPIRRTRFDLVRVACEAVDRQRDVVPEGSGHEFRVDADGGRPVEVEADEVRIDQVLTNLLVNAVAFSPGGGPIVVRVGADGSDGAVRLAVADAGVGVPAAERERIFEAFTRTAQPAAGGSSGTGLGLYIVRRIVEAHDGTVAVEDTPGGGATFVVRLPGPGLAAPDAL